MLEKQNGVCKICGDKETTSENGVTRRLAVDHCHSTGKVRGLLCGKCNKSLGGFKDSKELLLKVINYLEDKKEFKPIHNKKGWDKWYEEHY